MLKSVEFKNADIDMSKREITGYAATWDADQVGDIILPGAFKKTIEERGNRFKFMRNHSILIGKPVEVYEDSKGLITRSYVAETEHGEDTLRLAKIGALDEMSIQFSIPQGKSEFKDGLRQIKEIKLYEYGPVDFPANNMARIVDVKSLRQQLESGQHFTLKEIDELAAELAHLKALLTGAAAKGTANEQQPQDLEAVLSAIQNFGAVAR